MAENTTKDIWNDDDGAKEPPKKRRMLRKFLIFLLVLIAVLGLVLVAAWRDGTGFDALRRYFAYGTEAVGGERPSTATIRTIPTASPGWGPAHWSSCRIRPCGCWDLTAARCGAPT